MLETLVFLNENWFKIQFLVKNLREKLIGRLIHGRFTKGKTIDYCFLKKKFETIDFMFTL